jgi:lambda family phage portal protein
MGIFGIETRKDRKIATARAEERHRTEMRIANNRIKLAESTLRMTKAIETQMKSTRSMSDELYPSTNQSGPFSGLVFTDNTRMRRLSRLAVWQSAPAQELLTRFSDLVVGHGLRLESTPTWRAINTASWSNEQRAEWTKNTEARYRLWAKSKEIDYTKNMNLFQMEQESIKDLLQDGEYFEVYRYTQTSRRNPMTIQRIPPEDVRTPSGSVVASGNVEHQGIEYNTKGQAVAYHIYDHNTDRTVRVAKVGSRSGRVFVNHVKLGNKKRGVPFFADSIETLTKLGDWKTLEVQAAIINALFAVWIKPPDDMDGQDTLGSGIGKKSDPVQKNITDQYWQDTDTVNYQEGGVIVDRLPAGHSVESFDTKRPNINFTAFYDTIKRDLATSKGMSLSVMDLKLEGSYSSARGELLLVWNTIVKMRKNIGWSGNDVRYKMWLWGEVASGTIQAPGWNESDEMRDAWSMAEWVGSQRPDIDPLRSVKAAVEDQKMAYKTGKMISAERGGGDYDENLTVVEEELKRVARNQTPLENMQNTSIGG